MLELILGFNGHLLQRAPKFPRSFMGGGGSAGAGPVWHLSPSAARDRARLAPISLAFRHRLPAAGVAVA